MKVLAKLWQGALPVLLALLFTSLLLLMMGASPLHAYGNLLRGALGSPTKLADLFTAWAPLTLCAAGLLVTFTAGLWNIGIEGQIVLGAIMTAWVARTFGGLPAVALIPLLLLAAAFGGALWGLINGLLKVYGGVHEIFGGLGLNFVAKGLILWLIFVPWKPPDGATMSGTDPFPQAAWLPRLGNLRVSPLSPILAAAALGVVFILLRGTYWGLQLKAIGKNARAAFLQGIPTTRHTLAAFALCGALAGLAGATQAAGVYRRLIPEISSGYGFMALLVVLLASFRAAPVPWVALFFAAVGVGSPQLELKMQLDSSLGGILEASVVLFVLLVQGVRTRFFSQARGEA